ncbi:MAG TPA: isoleucine--tRNA ligase, partial [Solirubrobacterales bacterium]|nr:isoleucine--tRNA ligase [Solirubrobacterales bacterium]
PVDPRQSFPELEERVLARWRERDVFRRQLEAHAGDPPWTFYEGPPTANGRPGSHHVLSRTFKDIYPRFRTMRGYRVPRKAGWDTHGLPVELEVEKELGITSKADIEAYGIAEFNARCRESVFRYVEDWNRLTERIGFWIDLDDPYVTLDNTYIESVWWSLRRIWDDGRLYERNGVVPYCPRDQTTLSSHEVALGYKDVEDPSVYVKLPVTEVPPSDEITESPLRPEDRLLVWTTTPWTLITNAAVAVGPEIEYVRARVPGSDEVYVLAADLVERVLGEGAEVLAHLPGSALAGVAYEPPFSYITDYGPRGHTVLEADFVTTSEGTGLVHTAIAFGEDDFRLGEQYGIKLQNPVRPDGSFDERITDFEGRFVKDADEDIVEALRERGLLLRAETYEHAYPHCWRCDTPLLYYAKSSWYIRTTEVCDRMLAENERIDWHPERIKHGRFGKWLEGNVDWALSRERYWGTPLPVWECASAECEERFCAGSIDELRERGDEVPDDLHRPYIDDVVIPCTECGGEMRRVAEVIDAWFDSGSMPFAQFHYPFEGREEFEQRFPAEFICEAIDQTRGWFYSLLAVSVLLFDTTSYRHCVCLGLILDPEGQKMSKSRGNVVEPSEVIDRHGADALRWYYLTSQQPWSGYRFSVDTVGEAVRQFMLTLWNTYSFWVLYANAEGIDAAEPPEVPGDPSNLDRWALSRLQGTIREVTDGLEAFDSTAAGGAIAGYVDELSNWYVRLSRRRFWEGDRAAFGTLRRCLLDVSALLAPFTPFLADEIWLNLAWGETEALGDAPDSVHLLDFPEPDEGLEDADLELGMAAVRRAVELGRAARAQAGVKVRQPLRKAVIVATDRERDEIQRLSELVARELNVKEIEFVAEEAELVRYEVKPNYRSLGPRFGKLMPQAAAAVEALDPTAVAEAVAGERTIGIQVNGTEHDIEPDDVSLVLRPLDGYQVEAESGRAVALALDLDDELRREGLAREVVHAVQNARRDAGLEVTDRIELRLGGDPELLDAARTHQDYVAGETLATSLSYDGSDGLETRIEGRELRIGVSATR